MTFTLEPVADPAAPLARRNPVANLGAALLISLPQISTVDPLTPAAALATAPQLLVLDEPTFGQDRRTWIELVTLLATLRDEGHAVIAVTHDDDFVQASADSTFPLGISRLHDPLPRRNPA